MNGPLHVCLVQLSGELLEGVLNELFLRPSSFRQYVYAAICRCLLTSVKTRFAISA